jgi:DNA polymerase-3 subunit delta'
VTEGGVVLFDRIEHQPSAIAAIRGAFTCGRLAHAHLFWGPAGVGKTRAALALAQTILCSGEAPPCGVCRDCDRVARLTHPDLHLVVPAARAGEAAPRAELETYAGDPRACLQTPRQATIGIERVRGIKLESAKASVERDRRVIVLREAERMTPEAAQAALKLIEEPRPGTYLLLTAGDPSHLLPTIVSRCQQVRFRPLPAEFVTGVLRESAGLEPEAARIVAGLAQGSHSRARELAAGDAVPLRDRAVALFEAPLRDAGEAAERVQSLGTGWSADAARLTADLLMTWYGDLVAVATGLGPEALVHADRLADLTRAAAGFSAAEARRRITILEEMLEAIDQNVNPALALQASLLRLHRLAEENPAF